MEHTIQYLINNAHIHTDMLILAYALEGVKGIVVREKVSRMS